MIKVCQCGQSPVILERGCFFTDCCTNLDADSERPMVESRCNPAGKLALPALFTTADTAMNTNTGKTHTSKLLSMNPSNGMSDCVNGGAEQTQRGAR